MSARINKKRRSKRKVHPLDQDRLIMDAIYCSKKAEVQDYFRQVSLEEDAAAKAHIERGGAFDMDAHLDRVHMRMGERFFHLLSPVMQRLFLKEYPQAIVAAPAQPAATARQMSAA